MSDRSGLCGSCCLRRSVGVRCGLVPDLIVARWPEKGLVWCGPNAGITYALAQICAYTTLCVESTTHCGMDLLT